jgi:hypothetical protein
MHDESSDCKKCPVDTFSDEAGSSSCEDCADNESSPAGAEACSSCPAGYECSDGTNKPCDEGKYSIGGNPCQRCEVGYMYVVRQKFTVPTLRISLTH